MTTQTTTTATCDRCDRTAEVYERDTDEVKLPFRWVILTRRRPDGAQTTDTMDLCPDCADAFERWRTTPELAPSAVGGSDG